MALIGADLSSYDPDSAASEYPYVILNVEDPRMAHKADLAHAAGAVIMLYSWVYPGDNGYSLSRSYAAEELLLHDGIRVAHHWLDYEQAGVGQWDLDAAAARRDARYAPSGWYTYLNTLESQNPHYPGPLWLAYYPEGYVTVDYYRQMSDTARRWGAVIHQWTSVAGPDGRDHNAILDEAWYASLSGAPPAPAPAPEDHRGEVDMVIYHVIDVHDPDKDTATGEWCAVFGDKGPTKITATAAYTHALAGVPWLDKRSSWDIIALGVTLAQARKDAAFWDTKV